MYVSYTMSKECHHCLLKLYCGRRINFGQYASSHSQGRGGLSDARNGGYLDTAVVFFFFFVVCLYIVFSIGMNGMFWEFVSNQEKSQEYTMER